MLTFNPDHGSAARGTQRREATRDCRDVPVSKVSADVLISQHVVHDLDFGATDFCRAGNNALNPGVTHRGRWQQLAIPNQIQRFHRETCKVSSEYKGVAAVDVTFKRVNGVDHSIA